LYIPVYRQPRPLGVTVLVFLEIIAGVIDIILGLLFLAIYSLALSILGMSVPGLGILLVPMIALFLFFGFFSFVLAFGLWTGRGWAWVSAIIFAIIGLGVSLFGLLFGSYFNLIPAVFYAVILLYLTTRGVRAFFGRLSPFYPPPPIPMQVPPPVAYPPPAYAPPMQPDYGGYAQSPQPFYYPPEQPPTTTYRQPFRRTGMCPYCLSPVMLDANQCPRCGSRLR